MPPQETYSGDFGKRPVTTIDDRVWQGGWKGRSRGGWGAMYLGLFTGLVIGCAIAFLPVLIMGVSASVISGSFILGAMAVCGAAGAIQGQRMGTEVGVSAGAASSAAKEILKEMRSMEARMTSAVTGKPVAELPSGSSTEAASYSDQVTQPEVSTAGKYINLKVGLSFAALGAIAGAILAFGPASIAAVGLMKAVWFVGGATIAFPTATQAVALTASIGSLLGLNFGINVPVISNKFSNFFGELLAGRIFQHKQTPSPAKNVEVSMAQTAQPSLTHSRTVTADEIEMLETRLQQREAQPKADLLAATRTTQIAQTMNR